MVKSEQSSAGRALILVVERDPHVRELEAYFLNEAGFEVDFADDGVAALARARETVPDILIAEVLIPKLDGLALCRKIKSEPATASVVVLIFSVLAAADRAREAGADAFVLKPLQEHRLVNTVRQLLAKRQADRHREAVP